MKSAKGRFRAKLHPIAVRFSSSLSVDRKLYREDIEGSLAHAATLARQGIISREDAGKIRKGLLEIRRELEKGTFNPEQPGKGENRFAADDIHMAIEQRLIAKIGDAGGKLHTARSRNDQAALDGRLYLRSAIRTISGHLRSTQRELLRLAEKYRDVIMPAYTHLQRAQPVLFAHHLLAYIAMLDRDAGRFGDAMRRVNLSPLGAAAATGTSFPIDRAAVASALRFDGIIENSIDAVSDRDVHLEAIAACAITMMHLSRLAEELVLWSTREWSFITIGDAFTTGSSIMPQKKNPDVAELIRGKTGRVYGDFMALLTVMKGLPLAYNRDMQEDKEPLFDAAETLSACLEVLAPMLKSITVNSDRFEKELGEDDLLATELADYLVRNGMAFRKAHAIVGRLVVLSEKKNLPLSRIPLEEYRKHSRSFAKDLYSALTPRGSIARKKSSGSTSPREVARAILRWKNRLK